MRRQYSLVPFIAHFIRPLAQDVFVHRQSNKGQHFWAGILLRSYSFFLGLVVADDEE